MGLIERDERGRLDALCAARLLWSGIVHLDPKGVTFDGHAHHFPDPVVDKGTASLWGLSRAEMESISGDVRDLLAFLERDHAFCLDPDALSPVIVDLLPEGPVTAASVFLLQAATHPLALEKTDANEVTVRYDETLSRGIPAFPDVVSRLVWDLREYGEAIGSFRLRFELLMRRVGGLPEIEEAIAGADTHFDSERDVFLEPKVPDRFHAHAPFRVTESDQAHAVEWEVLKPLERIISLEQARLACQAALPFVEGHVKSLEGKEERLVSSAPDARDPLYHVPDYSKTFKSNTKTARTFLTRSSISVVVGLIFVFIGRYLILNSREVGAKVASLIAGSLSNAFDTVGFFNGFFDSIGLMGGHLDKVVTAHATSGGPIERAAGFVGIFFVVLGIVIPLRRIMKLRRSLARESAWVKNNSTMQTTLMAHRAQEMSAALSQATLSWQAELKAAETERKAACEAKENLESAIAEVERALGAAYATSGLPGRYQNLAAVATVFDYLDQGRAQDVESALRLLDTEDASGIVSMELSHATAAQPTLVACVADAEGVGERVRRRNSWKVAEGDVRILIQDAVRLVDA